MRVVCDTLHDARLAAAAARTVCREASHTLHHCAESCACPPCKAARLLTEVIALLGEVASEAANRVY